MSDINVHLIDFPEGAKGNEAVTLNEDGSYSVFINARAASNKQQEAYLHALEHIKNDDFSAVESVNVIEAKRHRLTHKKPAEVHVRARKRKSLYDKYLARQKRREKAFAKLGMRTERYFADDEYGCPRVRTRVRW